MRGRGRDGEALAKEMVVFCHIHFTRGVDEALKRAGGGAPGIRERMLQLLYAESKEGYEALANDIVGTY